MDQQEVNTLFAKFDDGRKNGTNLLSAKEIESAKKIVASKEQSIAFLQRAGILDTHGELALPYR